MVLFQYLLYPFAILYNGITRFRNHLYNIDVRPVARFDLPIIAVGNLRVGGTGKSPHIEYLIRLLSKRYRVATLSRGYGRETNGLIVATNEVDARIIGDEPMQFYQKFGPKTTVAVANRRAEAIPHLLIDKPVPQVILLDDAFQHRVLIPGLNILLTEYSRPFYHDYVLPYGRLRESRKEAKRADLIIVSKCPEKIDKDKKSEISRAIRKYSAHNIPVFFSSIQYQQPIPLGKHSRKFRQQIILLTGIANDGPFIRYLSTRFNILKHLKYPDHFRYDLKSIETIRSVYGKFSKNTSVVTTEKDAVKLQNFEKDLQGIPLFYVPIEVYFPRNEQMLKDIIFNYVTKQIKQTELKT